MKETAKTFDAERYKQSQHAQWNEDSAAWYRWTPTLHGWFDPVTGVMLEMAQIKPGQRVLDIATGAGEPAISTAIRVGPRGYVLATDLSENMLNFACQAVEEHGLRNLETRVMDGENLDLPDEDFDIVSCRFALMLMPNRQRALSEWRRVLKPGGRAVVAVFSTPERNAWGRIPISIIRQRAQLPPPMPGQPGIFSLGGEGVLADVLRKAGFQEVETTLVSIPLRMPSAKEAIHFAREAFGGFNQMMHHLSHDERYAIWDEVEEAMREFDGPNGFQAPCEALVGVGVK